MWACSFCSSSDLVAERLDPRCPSSVELLAGVELVVVVVAVVAEGCAGCLASESVALSFFLSFSSSCSAAAYCRYVASTSLDSVLSTFLRPFSVVFNSFRKHSRHTTV